MEPITRGTKYLKPSYLAKLLAILGLEYRIDTYHGRLKLQKQLYLLKLHPKLRPYIPYIYDIYFSGPYSKELARTYYQLYLGDHVDGASADIDLEIDGKIRSYIKEVSKLKHRQLRLIATIAELMAYHGTRDYEQLYYLLGGIYRHATRKEYREMYNKLLEWERKYGVLICKAGEKT